MNGRLFAFLLLTSLALSACAGMGPVHTYKSFSGACLTYTRGNTIETSFSCGDQRDICDAFKPILVQEHTSQAACIGACQAMQYHLYRQFPVGDCRDVVRYAADMCGSFCREHYAN
jgi:hypothetical protein